MFKVLKFGGTSMASAAQYEKVRSIVEYDEARRAVVVSAAGKRYKDDHKITDLLYLCHAHLKYGVSCDSVFQMIAQRYLDIEKALGLDTNLTVEFSALRMQMEEGISEDALVSRGEYFSARLMAAFLGFKFIDAADWLRFHLDGSVDKAYSYARLRELAGDSQFVTPGFYGTMPDGSIRTFSRGGSDITGALVAAALDADVYENWTDVSGILMADPRIVDNPEPIPHITYAELRELSYLGAQVLHEDTIFPVAEKNIPLNIRNTNDPAHPGTVIMETFPNDEPAADHRFITGIAGKKDYTIVSVSKNGLSSQLGAYRRVLEVFETHGIPVEYIPNGIDTISLVVSTRLLQKQRHMLIADLQEQIQPDQIQLTENIAIVAAVGRKMAFRPGISGQIFAALGEHGINIRMISQGPQEVNIIVGVDGKDYAPAVRVLYDSFVK